MKKYWINSNTGDFIIEINHNKYKLILIDRVIDGKYLPSEIVNLTPSQFETIKGFIPVKAKKIKSSLKKRKFETLKNKNKTYQLKIPTISESRQYIINKIGI